MNIGILGTGMVAETLAAKLIEQNHAVKLGSRTAENPKALEWAAKMGASASTGTFADAAKFGDILFNCTKGEVSLEALEMTGRENLGAKILVDVANALDFSQSGFPTLVYCNTDSLGERIQNAYPDLKVVKALNTVNCEVMVAPEKVVGNHHLFIAGNDAAAKDTVRNLLVNDFGWPEKSILDVGDITAARATEQLMPIWMRLWKLAGHVNFNFYINGI